MSLLSFFRAAHPVEKIVGYRFRNRELLFLAMTHPSCVDSRNQSNQRLEFLGDAVLEICVSRWLYNEYPELDEGELTEYRRRLVQKQYLAIAAERLGLYEYLGLGEAERRLAGESKQGVLADAYEALMGAIFLDAGPQKAFDVVVKLHLSNPEPVISSDEYRNYKGELLEYAQSIGRHPDYSIEDISGEKHLQVFRSCVRINGQKLGMGEGTSKKSAEQAAAKMALQAIEHSEND